MINTGLVLLGGGIGAVARYTVNFILNKFFSLKHWSTFWINIFGCFLLGLLFEYCISINMHVYNFVIVGIIGSYTTFSTFEYENIDLIAHEQYAEFLKYSVLSCVFGFLSVALGFYFVKILNIIF